MKATVFYRKWRPQTLEEVVGQEHITKTLLNALSTSRLTHAYVFCGPKGTGKTSTGRILAKALNCENNDGKGEPCNNCLTCQSITDGRCLDVIEIDAASNRGVDEIRNLCEKVNYAPNNGRFKVYIIDEFHMLTTEASNALLKTLEEPPTHVVFILATTEAHKILPTILSRCQRYDFRKVSLEVTTNQLQKIAQGEGISCPKEALAAIARAGGGSLRDAENLLQQLYTHYGEQISLENAKEMLGMSNSNHSLSIVEAILHRDGGSALLAINQAEKLGTSPKTLLKDVLNTLRLALLAKNACLQSAELTNDEINRFNHMVSDTSLSQILRSIRLFAASDNNAESGMLPLEIAAAEAAVLIDEKQQPSVALNAPSPTSSTKTASSPDRTLTPIKKAPSSDPKSRQTSEITSEEVLDMDNLPSFGKVENKPAAESTEKAEIVTPLNPSPPPFIDDIQTLREKLREFSKNAAAPLRNSVACAILRSSGIFELEEIKDGVANLAFKHRFHMEKLTKDASVYHDAEEIICQALGQRYKIICRLEEGNYLEKELVKMGAKKIKEAQS